MKTAGAATGEQRETRLNLPGIRRNRGLSLRAIAEETKIRLYYLEAIESERFGLLPGEIYTRSYIRQYARAIDYDEGAILALYWAQCAPPDQFRDPAPDRRLGAGLTGTLRLAGRRCRLLLKPLLP